MTKFKNLLLQNHWANFNQTWHKASLGEGDSSLFTWRATFFSKGRWMWNNENILMKFYNLLQNHWANHKSSTGWNSYVTWSPIPELCSKKSKLLAMFNLIVMNINKKCKFLRPIIRCYCVHIDSIMNKKHHGWNYTHKTTCVQYMYCTWYCLWYRELFKLCIFVCKIHACFTFFPYGIFFIVIINTCSIYEKNVLPCAHIFLDL